jgi:hypothetical protein
MDCPSLSAGYPVVVKYQAQPIVAGFRRKK